VLELFEKFRTTALTYTNIVGQDNKDFVDYIWKNEIFSSSLIRYGHLEYFKSKNNKVEVIHCVFYPTPFVDLPIYGFDVIALGGKVTGVFCDLTCSEKPEELTTKLQLLHTKYLSYKRDLPNWGSFFSKHFLILDPKDKLNEIENDCLDLFNEFLKYNIDNTFMLFDKQAKDRIESHNNYSLNQRKNTKTQKALAHYIGEKEAESFINNVLFPTYK
jgi:phycocyanobilin:ferredoxin oxidoreductase